MISIKRPESESETSEDHRIIRKAVHSMMSDIDISDEDVSRACLRLDTEMCTFEKHNSLLDAKPQAMVASRIKWMMMGLCVGLAMFTVTWNRDWIGFPPGELASQDLIYRTGNGARAMVVLPDSSKIVLNAASSVMVPTDYSEGNRSIKLEGEAIFEVRHKKGLPFTVNAGPGTIQVLGTRFVVRHYDTDTSTRVSVEDGKVSVNSTVLAANQEVHVTARTISAIMMGNPAHFSFEAGVISINGLPLRDVIHDLNRWYNVDIRIADSSLRNRRLTLQSATGSAADIAAILELALNTRVVREGRNLTIHPR